MRPLGALPRAIESYVTPLKRGYVGRKTMQEDPGAVELRSGKGVRAGLNEATVTFLAEAMDAVNTAWTTAETPEEAFKLLQTEWNTFATDNYGDRTWTAMPFRSEDEFRVTVVLKGKRLNIDFREFFMPH